MTKSLTCRTALKKQVLPRLTKPFDHKIILYMYIHSKLIHHCSLTGIGWLLLVTSCFFFPLVCGRTVSAAASSEHHRLVIVRYRQLKLYSCNYEFTLLSLSTVLLTTSLYLSALSFASHITQKPVL